MSSRNRAKAIARWFLLEGSDSRLAEAPAPIRRRPLGQLSSGWAVQPSYHEGTAGRARSHDLRSGERHSPSPVLVWSVGRPAKRLSTHCHVQREGSKGSAEKFDAAKHLGYIKLKHLEICMAITRLKLRQFTAFREIDVRTISGINVIVGGNGTGKTHLMKAAYAACDISKTRDEFSEKILRTFFAKNIGRLVRQSRGQSSSCRIEVFRGDLRLLSSFSRHAQLPSQPKVTGADAWCENPVESVYIPAKEVLANAPGLRSHYLQGEIHLEETDVDIIDRAYRPPLCEDLDTRRTSVLSDLQLMMGGVINTVDEEFFLKNRREIIDFSLLSEGIRKLGLLSLLIQNGTIRPESVLFWDEPESNLNPRLFKKLIEILLQLQEMGVQVFIATHSYVILKELDLQTKEEGKVAYHALFRKGEGDGVCCHTTDSFLKIHPNAIVETFDDLYDREVVRSLGGQRDDRNNGGKDPNFAYN